MTFVTVRIFVSHPVAAAQYAQALTAERDIRLATDKERFQVGVFDTETSSEAQLTLARLKFPSMRPLLVSRPCDENECLRWLFRGVWGLISYDHYEKELPQAVRHLAGGQVWFPAPVVIRWMRIDSGHRFSVLRLPLTAREREVAEFLARRFSNKEIAGILGISERTVKFHVGNILTKLRVGSRQELMAKWIVRPSEA